MLGPHYSRHPRRVVADAIAGPITELLRRELESIAARLAEYEGRDLMARNGCAIEVMDLGNTSAPVEFEVQPASGDGFEEPRFDGSVTPVQVYLNGRWCDIADAVPEEACDRWVEEVQGKWAAEADAFRIEAEIAAREFA